MRVFHWEVDVFPNMLPRKKAATIAIIESIIEDEKRNAEAMASGRRK